MQNRTVLNIDNISKTYSKGSKGETKALNNVSFSLNSNEITGLIGPNGAGKTTLIRTIMGFELPDSGNISFLDNNPTDLSVRDKIGYQADLQFRSKAFTVYNYLKFHADMYGVPNSSNHINSLLEKFTMSEAKHKKLNSLSKGMRQKVELMFAFLNSPQLVVLDEPTSALDPPSVFELRDFIGQYKANGATILFSSHHLTEVEKVCDRVIFIDSGKIILDVFLSETDPGFLENAFRKYETERKFV